MKVSPKKHLGQHFLTSPEIAQKIAQYGAVQMENALTVIEIGPGTGALTKHLEDLVPQHKLFLAEVDQESITYLKAVYGFNPDAIISRDFLKLDLSDYTAPLHITGNFPYNISSQILFKILDFLPHVNSMHGMFQKEVAERICAQPGSKIYGILSVLTQAYFHTEYGFTVNEGAFNPPPKVKSGVMRMHKRDELPDVKFKDLKALVKQAFNQRRKTIRNSLKSYGISSDHPMATKRPEQLSVSEFIALCKELT